LHDQKIRRCVYTRSNTKINIKKYSLPVIEALKLHRPHKTCVYTPKKRKKHPYNVCIHTFERPKMKRWNLFLPPELIENYKKLAAKKGVSSAEMARIAMEKYLQAVEKAKARGDEAQKATSETANVA